MKLLLLADFHLGARLLQWRTFSAERRNVIRDAWHEAVDIIVTPEQGIDAVLVAGDLFDQLGPDPDDLDSVTEGIARIVEGGKPVVLIPGVYDGLFSTRSIYHTDRLPKGTMVVTEREERRVEIAVGMETLHLYTGAVLPGPGSRLSETRRGDGEGAHVGLFHACVGPQAGAEAWAPPVFTPTDLEQTGLDLIVLGGEHNFRDVHTGKTVVVVPGTPVGLRLEEAGDRFFVTAEIVSGEVQLSRNRRDIPPVVYVDLDLGNHAFRSEGALAAHLREKSLGAALLSVRLHGTVESPVDVHSLEAVLTVLPLPVEIQDETVLAGATGSLEKMAGEGSVREQFVRKLQDRMALTTDEAEQRVLGRALQEGLLEFERAEALHVD